VVWDREREEGMMIIYRGKGWEGRIREESKEGRKELGKRSLGPKQNSWIRH
jgi:hypothetical protein